MENAKQKAIREAYGRFFNNEKYHYSINGWMSLDSVDANELGEMIYEINLEFGDHRFRPKSLQGIETNNGWIRIESEKDLPSEDCFIECISNRKNKDVMKLYEIGGFKAIRFIHHFDASRDIKYIIEKAESYKIIPFNEPIY